MRVSCDILHVEGELNNGGVVRLTRALHEANKFTWVPQSGGVCVGTIGPMMVGSNHHSLHSKLGTKKGT